MPLYEVIYTILVLSIKFCFVQKKDNFSCRHILYGNFIGSFGVMSSLSRLDLLQAE